MRPYKAVLGAIALGLSVFSAGVSAQEYPTKPITLIVPFSAGGPTDTVARSIAASMQDMLKQTVVVENVGGAGGTIGVGRGARAEPDGYTITMHHIGMSTAPTLYRKLAFDPLKDFEYIGLVADVPMTIIARGDFPSTGLKDFLAYAKANHSKMSYANAGIGSASHLCGLMFMSALGVDFVTVPYKGTGPAMNDLLGGQVDFMCDQTTNTTSQIKAGKVKAYAVTTAQRVASLSDLPTLQEGGMKGFEVGVWHGLYAPKGTPKPVMDKLVAALQHALKDPAVKERFNSLGTAPVPIEQGTPDALRKKLTAEIAKWAPVIKAAGQYAD